MEHRMRVLITGRDAEGRSCVVREETELAASPDASGFWMGTFFQTGSAPPAGQGGVADLLDVDLPAGLARWQVIDYPPNQSYPTHRTDTIDLDLVLAGSLELHLDDGVHVLHAGDGVVVDGVDHAWKAGPAGARLSVVFLATA